MFDDFFLRFVYESKYVSRPSNKFIDEVFLELFLR